MDLEAGTLLEVNKQLSSQEDVLSENAIKRKQEEVRLWFKNYVMRYAMLLCNEVNDYTVFNRSDSDADAAEILIECLKNRGEIVSIDSAPGPAFEIWIRMKKDDETEEDYCYYLFNYDAAVIEC